MGLNSINIGLGLDTRAFSQGLQAAQKQMKGFAAKMNTTLGDAFSKVEKKLGQVERKLNRFGRGMEQIGGNLTQSVSVPLGIAGGAAIKAAADFERLETQFKVLIGNDDDAQAFFKTLQDFSSRTPFQFADIAQAAQSMLAFGFSTDQAKDSLQFLGDISAATGAGLSDLTLILGQAKAIGAVYTQDLRQLANRGIPVFDLLKEKLGVTGEELDKMVTDGAISFEILQDALRSTTEEGGLFADGMKKQSSTISGLFSTLKDNVQLALGTLGKDIIEAFDLRGALERLTTKIQNAIEWFTALDSQTKKNIITFAAIAAAIGPVLLIIGKLSSVALLAVKGFGVLVTAIKGVATALTFLAANPVTAIAIAIGVVLAGAVVYVIENFKALKAAGINAWGGLKNAIGSVIKGILFQIDSFVKNLTGINLNLSDKFQFDPAETVDQPRMMGLAETFEAFGKRVKGALGLIPPAAKEASAAVEELNTDTKKIETTLTTTGGGTAQPKREGVEQVQEIEGVTIITPESTSAQLERFEQVKEGLAGLQEAGTVFNEQIAEQLAEQGEKWQSLASAISGPLNEAFGGVFDKLINEGKLSFESFGDVVKKLIVKLLKAVAVAAALTALFTIISGGSSAGLKGIKGLLGFGNNSLFKGFLGGLVPGLAEGGIIPPGYPNDTFPAMLSSNEAVIPLSKLSGTLGGGNGYIAETRISGEDLMILVKQAEQKTNRFS